MKSKIKMGDVEIDVTQKQTGLAYKYEISIKESEYPDFEMETQLFEGVDTAIEIALRTRDLLKNK